MKRKVNSDYTMRHYNSLVNNLGETNYINYKWFRDEITIHEYNQTKIALISDLERRSNFINILEVGCGPGVWTTLLAQKCKRLVAVDISEAMLKQAKKNVSDNNVTLICADFLNWPLKFVEFDAIYAIRVFEYFSDKKLGIRTAKDLLKQGGVLCIITKNPCFLPKKVIDFSVKNKKIMGIIKHLPLSERATKLINVFQEKLHSDWISPKESKILMQKEGFEDIHIRPVIIGLSYSNVLWKFFDWIHLKCYNKKLNLLLLPFTESYLIAGVKK